MRKLVTAVDNAIDSILTPPVLPKILGTKLGQRKGDKGDVALPPPLEVAVVDESNSELGGGGKFEVNSSDSDMLLAQVAATERATSGTGGVVATKTSGDAAAAGSIFGGISITTAAIVGGSAVVVIAVVASGGGDTPQATAPVNNAPTATNLSAAQTYTEDTVLNLADIVANDVDSPNITATLTLSDVAAGSLSTATSGTVISTFVNGVWSASGALADVNALLAGVTFTPTLNFNSNFTLATSVSDGVATITGSKTMTGTAINNAPALTAGDGLSIIQVGAAYDAASSIMLQTDGKILVAGRSDSAGNNSDFSLIRMNNNGRLDTTFDVDGKAIIPVGGAFDEARSMSLQADGKILLAGNSFNGVGNTFVFSLIRLNANGSLDTTWFYPVFTDTQLRAG